MTGFRPVRRRSDSLSSGFPIRRYCVRRTQGGTPASFARIQRLNQFLNQRTELRGVTLVRDRNAEFAPILLHAVRHTHLQYSGANACEMLQSVVHVWCHDVKCFCCLRFTKTVRVISSLGLAILRYWIQWAGRNETKQPSLLEAQLPSIPVFLRGSATHSCSPSPPIHGRRIRWRVNACWRSR